MILPSIGRNSFILGLFALITTAGIAATFLGTKDIIAEQRRKAEQAALLEIFPLERHDNQMLDDTLQTDDKTYLQLGADMSIYIALKNQQVAGFILPAIAPQGYTDKIRMIIGINVDGSIAGVRVLSHRETPGLGDKVELTKSDWILAFNGKSLLNPRASDWKVKKDKGVFDQFTGATITPRAVTKAVYDSLRYYEKNRERLILQAQQQLLEDDEQEDEAAQLNALPRTLVEATYND